MKGFLKKSFWMFILLPLVACGENEERQMDVAERLQDVSRLELARMTVGKVGMISDPSYADAKSFLDKAEAAFNQMKVGTRIGVYSYDTYLTAYVDLSELRQEDVTVDEENKTVEILLPAVRVTTDGREPQLHEEHYRVTGLRSSITPAERARLKARMAAEVKKEMSANTIATASLRKSAEEKAKVWLTNLLEDWGYDATVSFRSF